MISLVVSLIFILNLTVFIICNCMPLIVDENAVEESSGDFELQPREPITLSILGIFFLIRTFLKLFQSRQNNQQSYPPAPVYYSAAPGSPVYQLPVPVNTSTSKSFKIFLWNMYENWQRKLGVNPNNYVPPPPHLLSSKQKYGPVNSPSLARPYMSTWQGFKFFLWNYLENKQRKLKLDVPYPPPASSPLPPKS